MSRVRVDDDVRFNPRVRELICVRLEGDLAAATLRRLVHGLYQATAAPVNKGLRHDG